MNPRAGGIGVGLAEIGSGLAGMFGGGGSNPYNAASKYFNQIPGKISPYFDPYINAGRGALSQLQGQYGNLINDPTALMNKIGAGYQKSPGYDFQMQQGMNAVNNAAAAGGQAGNAATQYNAGSFANNLANQDYYNYLNHGLAQYGMGLQGLGGINQMGYNASNEMGGALANLLQNQGQLAFAGQAAKNQAQGANWGDLFGGLGTLAGFMF